MSQAGIELLLDRWMNDSAFRDQMRADPEATVRATGAALDEDEWAALRSVDWTQSDEELQSRLSGC
jgi:hypothetical protein